jgi:hypothetical protein
VRKARTISKGECTSSVFQKEARRVVKLIGFAEVLKSVRSPGFNSVVIADHFEKALILSRLITLSQSWLLVRRVRFTNLPSQASGRQQGLDKAATNNTERRTDIIMSSQTEPNQHVNEGINI